MKGTADINVQAVVPAPRWRRRAAGVAIILATLVGIGSTTKVTVDLLSWRSSVHAARQVGQQPGRPAQDYVDAAIVLQRDVLDSIAVLRQIAERDGTAGANGKVILANIERAAR